ALRRGVLRVAAQSAGQRAGEYLAEEGQPRALVAAEGEDGAWRLGVEGFGSDGRPPCAVEDGAGRHRLAFITRDLELSFGDRRRRDVEDQWPPVRPGCACGDGVGR